MRTSEAFVRGAVTVAVSVAAVSVGGVAAHAASITTPTTRYASPTGVSKTTCAKSSPCDIVSAINNAPQGAEVILAAGTYGASAPLTTTLEDNAPDLYIHGESAVAKTVIDSTAPIATVSLDDGSQLSDVTIHYTGSAAGLAIQGASSADHVVVVASGQPNYACSVNGVLSDSVCLQTTGAGDAIFGVSDDAETGSLRGVTAEATGAGGAGLALAADTNVAVSMNVANSIIHGSSFDIVELETQSGNSGTVAITVTHSDFATQTQEQPSEEYVASNSTDIEAAPRFVDSADGNFAEAAGSPTVNQGAPVAFGDTDLAGLPRTMGSSPDMGAFELEQKPVVERPTVTAKTKTAVRARVTVNPEGLPTKVHLVATHGHQSISSSSFLPGEGTSTVSAKLTVTGLKKHTKYRVVADVRSAAGAITSSAAGVTTPARTRPTADTTAPAIRYAVPTGGVAFGACSSAEPCNIATAVGSAPPNSQVDIAPGTYSVRNLDDGDGGDLYIHGEAGKAVPVLDYDDLSGGDEQSPAMELYQGSRVSDVTINYTGEYVGLILNPGTADHVTVNATDDDAEACDINGTLTGSVCNGNLIAVGSEAFTAQNATTNLRGVTAVVQGSDAESTEAAAVNLEPGSGHLDSLIATNSVFDGIGYFAAGISTSMQNDGTQSVTLHSSDYSSIDNEQTSSVATITVDSTDIHAQPEFDDATDDNFGELPGSPTIDKGATDPAADTDLAGLPRTMGSAPDMGAYEFSEKAAAGKPRVTAKPTTATVTVPVNAEGLPTTLTVVTTNIYTGTVTVSPSVSAGSATTTKSVKLTIKGLTKRSQYTMVVVARSVAGHTDSATVLATTPAK